jgi:hypothetical protein
MFAMVIDHIAVGILDRWLLAGGALSTQAVYDTAVVMRAIGRIAFPIFCFLLAEGFRKTSHRGRYAARLAVFALISEVPFDLLLYGKVLEFSHQNVYFTLCLGLLAMALIEKTMHRMQQPRVAHAGNAAYAGSAAYAVSALLTLAVMFLADVIRADYGAVGVLMMVILYVKSTGVLRGMFGACLAMQLLGFGQIWAFAAVPLVFFYNEKRGRGNKYFFYAFYPLHLFLLWLITFVG